MGRAATIREPDTQLFFPPNQRRNIIVPSPLVRESMGQLFDVTAVQSPADNGYHFSQHWFSARHMFVHMESAAFAARKTKAQLSAGEHLLFVQRYFNGGVRGRVGDVNVDRWPGAIHVVHQDNRIEAVQQPLTSHGIFLPITDVGYNPDRHPILISYPCDQPIGRLLDYLMTGLFNGLMRNHTVQTGTLNEFVACLKLALDPGHDAEDVRALARAAMTRAIQAFIEQNLDDWDLSVTTILRNFGVSRASLYRLFDMDGGVRQYISDRRLMRAVLDLTQRSLKRGDIAAVAERWGFSSAANFNRAVRNEYGVTPGTLVNTPAPAHQLLHLSPTQRAYSNWFTSGRSAR